MRTAALPAIVILLLASACGSGGGNGSSSTTTALVRSPQINMDETEFAEDSELRANPDDLLVVRLEHPAAPAEPDDTGDDPGVDEIPYAYIDTSEHRFCWEGDASAGADTAAPHYMSLLDDAGDEVVRVEEDGACVSRVIPAGRYSAVFHHGGGARADRDVLFVVPQQRPENPLLGSAAADTGVVTPDGGSAADQAHSSSAALAATEEPEPFCAYVKFDGKTPQLGDPPFPIPSGLAGVWSLYQPPRGRLPFGPLFVAFGACSDASLIADRAYPPFLGFWALVTGEHTGLRIYQEHDFRGSRRTLTGFSPPIQDPDVDRWLFRPSSSFTVVKGIPGSNVDVVIQTNHCNHCDLSGMTLSGDLHGVSLIEADLTHAELSAADLTNAMAVHALFQSAHMAGTVLDGAQLQGASFDSAGQIEGSSDRPFPPTDLSGASLIGTALTGASLRNAVVAHADFSDAIVDDADLRAVTGSDVVFLGSHLNHAALIGATLPHANFGNAQLTRADLSGLTAPDARFTKAQLDHARLQGATLTRARFDNAVMNSAVLGRDAHSGATEANLREAYLANAVLDDADLNGVNLVKARFYGDRASAESANFTAADLSGALLSGANFGNATLKAAILDGATCVACNFAGAHLQGSAAESARGAELNDADLRGASFDAASIGDCNFTNATISFREGHYVVGRSPDAIYAVQYGATELGPIRTDGSIKCPDGGRGPCDSMDRLRPIPAPPTPTAVPSPAAP